MGVIVPSCIRVSVSLQRLTKCSFAFAYVWFVLVCYRSTGTASGRRGDAGHTAPTEPPCRRPPRAVTRALLGSREEVRLAVPVDVLCRYCTGKSYWSIP